MAPDARRRVESAIRSCENASSAKAAAAGARLARLSRRNLPRLAASLGESSPVYADIADRVAAMLLHVSRIHWNEHITAESSAESAIGTARDCEKLARYALEIACVEAVRSTAEVAAAEASEFIGKATVAAAYGPIQEWLERTQRFIRSDVMSTGRFPSSISSPEEELEFMAKAEAEGTFGELVQASQTSAQDWLDRLEESVSGPESVVESLREWRAIGTTHWGSDFGRSETFVRVTSDVFGGLASFPGTAAVKAPDGSEEEYEAFRSLFLLQLHFCPSNDSTAEETGRDAPLPVSPEVWDQIMPKKR